MLEKFKNKITSKKGASDIVVVLIIVVIFAAVSYFVFSTLGNNCKDAGSNVSTQVTNTTNAAGKFAASGTFK